MLRIYTDPALGRPEWPLVPMIHGSVRDVGTERSGTTWERRLMPWWDVAGDHISLTSLADADMAVLPFDWYRVRGESWTPAPTARCGMSPGGSPTMSAPLGSRSPCSDRRPFQRAAAHLASVVVGGSVSQARRS